MIVSPPRLNLRRAASYQGSQSHDKIPLSATSSCFDFNHLLFSPPPSPGLPALVPRPRKSPTLKPRPSRVVRLVTYAAGLLIFLYLARSIVRKSVDVPMIEWALTAGEEYEMVGQYDLPEFPTPIAITDRRGRSKWTISIPPTYDFPLTVKEYSEICAKCQEVAAHVRELDSRSYPSQKAQFDYYYEDPYFLDVKEAEKRGLLPGIENKSWQVTAKAQDGHVVGENKDGLVQQGSCKTSLTFVLESPDAGIGPTLMMLWMAYGLAQKEKRAFFIDDSRWAYGEYTDIFQAPPAQGCSPPPRHEMLPCPHHARHLVVSVATARDTFGNSFTSEYEHHRKSDVDRERPMYDLARVGHEALFHLNDNDHTYVQGRIQELKAKVRVPAGNNDGTIIGVHVRHGDLHPYDYQYSSAYLPNNLYADKLREILEDYHNTSNPDGGEDVVAKQRSLTVLASDDPDVYESEEFAGSLRAQELIKLASVAAIKQVNPDKHVMHKFVDETFGWEGGFFASMFWNLGRSTLNTANAADMPATALGPPAETIRLRNLIGRAYMMDLAVLGQGSDVVICTVSAMGCRLMAVIMGWEKAIESEKWVNIDGNYHWTGISL
ncbi:uncharacterized protein BCR38DRAFT_483528 [Pseudomassariella vexata]|uniref:Uncharacterized protein n=1 Tax=Pseudomassariella vexata TaxID=1141098 RepID=A0A1Y2E2U3_9PEZI|nr:uncharacterized protein BCR38DRAFT_483528 [Pseudomassariella vexata]ORY65852.1 hypothetical protein BCR38DRAFT_483528 [Pseudomassariella vexata]